jgi:hypothetical protein
MPSVLTVSARTARFAGNASARRTSFFFDRTGYRFGKRRREYKRNHADIVFGFDPEAWVASLCASVNRFISSRFQFLLAIFCFRSR